MREVVGVLDNIRSLHNVGSMFRTADGAGIKKLYLCGITPAPEDPLGRPRGPLAKVSLGAQQHVAWQKSAAAARLLNTLRSQGFYIVIVEQAKGSVALSKFKLPARRKKIALVVGNEVSGVSRSVLSKANVILEIPMRGKKESLNVSVAFGIVAYSL